MVIVHSLRHLTSSRNWRVSIHNLANTALAHIICANWLASITRGECDICQILMFARAASEMLDAMRTGMHSRASTQRPHTRMGVEGEEDMLAETVASMKNGTLGRKTISRPSSASAVRPAPGLMADMNLSTHNDSQRGMPISRPNSASVARRAPGLGSDSAQARSRPSSAMSRRCVCV